MSAKRQHRDFGGKNRRALAAMNAARVRDVYPDATRPRKHCDRSGYAPNTVFERAMTESERAQLTLPGPIIDKSGWVLDAQLGEMRDGPVLGDGGGSYFGSLADAAAEKGGK